MDQPRGHGSKQGRPRVSAADKRNQVFYWKRMSTAKAHPSWNVKVNERVMFGGAPTANLSQDPVTPGPFFDLGGVRRVVPTPSSYRRRPAVPGTVPRCSVTSGLLNFCLRSFPRLLLPPVDPFERGQFPSAKELPESPE